MLRINMSLKNKFALLLSIIWQLAQESGLCVFVCQICGILLILYKSPIRHHHFVRDPFSFGHLVLIMA